MKKIFLILVLVFASLTTFSQSADQEQFINDLRNLHSLLLSKDYAKAKECFITPRFISEEEMNEMLGRLIENSEISDAGIELLSKNGTFGSLRQIFPEKADKWITDLGESASSLLYKKFIIDKNGVNFPVYVKKGNDPYNRKIYENSEQIPAQIDPATETLNIEEAEIKDDNPYAVNYQIRNPLFAMKYGSAEVAGSWDGEHFRFFRLDDVGKLK
jgi:hypothetical protein